MQVTWPPSPCRVESLLVDGTPAFLFRMSMNLNVDVVVQFYPWFKFYFPLFQTHYNTLPIAKQGQIIFKLRIKLNHNIGIGQKFQYVAWENSRHLAMLPLVSPPNDIWETSAEIPYWWCIVTQIWVVLLISRAAWEIWFNQSEALPRSG